MSTYRLMDGQSGRPGIGSSGTQPPSAPTAFSGNYIAGLVFSVASTAWMTGYYWWVPPGGDTGPVRCALWQQGSSTQNSVGTLVPNSVVTSGTLTAGQWNYVALPSQLPLSITGTTYVAALGYATTIGFPDSQHQFGAGNPYASGITNGVLSAPNSNIFNGITNSGPQQPYSTAGSDPSLILPTTNDLDDILWLDVQVTDTPPADASYRLWPSRPYSAGDGTNGGVSTVTDGYTMALQFSVTQACALDKIWFYSAPAMFSGAAAVAIPTRVTLWDTATQLPVAGGDINGVSWKKPDGTAGVAASGWVYADFSAAGITLSAGHAYKASVWYAGGQTWRTVVDTYWASPGAGLNGIVQGALAAPNSASASPGQNSWSGPNLAWAYPNSFSFAENDWVDVEVTPLPPSTGDGTSRASGLPGSSRVTPIRDQLGRQHLETLARTHAAMRPSR